MQSFRIFFTFVLIFSLASVSTGRFGWPDRLCEVCLLRSGAPQCRGPCRGAPPPSFECAECVKELAPECMEACGVTADAVGKRCRLNNLEGLPGDYARCHNNGEWKLDEPIKNITDTVVSNGEKLDELLDRPPPGPGPWCIQDNPRRVFTTFMETGESTTVDGCLEKCLNFNDKGDFDPHTKDGFFYAGLEVGTQCFCGQYVPLDLLLPADECDWGSCAGAETDDRPCGGFWKLSVYPTGLEPIPPPTPSPTTTE